MGDHPTSQTKTALGARLYVTRSKRSAAKRDAVKVLRGETSRSAVDRPVAIEVVTLGPPTSPSGEAPPRDYRPESVREWPSVTRD